MKTCAFCGSTGRLTKEHVFPAWLRTQANADLILSKETLRIGDRVASERTGGHAFNRTARIVCEPCNTGWMSSLEEAAMPILMPLLDGFSSRLDARQQRVVGAWSAKTCLAVARVRSDLPQLAPSKHYRDMALSRGASPAEGVSVWLGTDRASRNTDFLGTHILAFSQRSKTVTVNGASATLYGHIVRLHRLVVQVIGWADPEHESLIEHEGEEDYLIRVWPIKTSQVEWPPQADLSDEVGFDRLAGRIQDESLRGRQLPQALQARPDSAAARARSEGGSAPDNHTAS